MASCEESFSFGTKSEYFFVPSTGNLGVAFPFTTTTKGGSYQNYFSHAYSNLFAGPFISFGLSSQIPSKKRHFFDLGLGLGGSNRGKNIAYFFAGYGQKFFSNTKFSIEASIDAAYYEFGNTLGGIDNWKKNISLLGTVADSTFTVSHYRSKPSVVYADVLYIDYLQKDYMLIPKVACEYFPFEGNRFFVGVNFSCLIPVFEKGTIRLEQVGNGEPFGSGSSFPLTSSGLTLTYNNIPITATPYHFSGLQISLKIGWVIGKGKPVQPNKFNNKN